MEWSFRKEYSGIGMVGHEFASLALDVEAFLVSGDEFLSAEATGFRRQ